MSIRYTEDTLKEGMILPFDKPYKWTSFDLVNKIRRSLCLHAGIKKLKVGHAGTLDPLATGLLILCVGKATRQIESIQNLEKEYVAEITFGASTPSFDMETEIEKEYPVDHINRSVIEEKLKLFHGEIEQVPPLYSAKKFNGVRAYEYAREGIEKKMKPVRVTLYGLEILRFDAPVLELKINCSKGTYIRSLAHDLGKSLASGAYLSGLRRTAIGPYHVDQAEQLENFQKKLNIL